MVIFTSSGCARDPVALSSTSCTAGVLWAWSSSISAQLTFRPSSVLPSADSGTNLLEVSFTRIECVSTSTPNFARNAPSIRAICWAMSKTIFAWSRVVAAE